MKSFFKYLIPLIIAITLVYLMFIRAKGDEVPVAEVVRGTAVDAVTGTVEVFANADVDLKTERRGILEVVKVKVGEEVEIGTVIAVQSSREINLRIENAQIRLNAARERSELVNPLSLDVQTIEDEIEAKELAVNLKQASQSDLDRAIRELEKKNIYLSLQGISEVETIELLENQLEQFQLEKEQMTLKAPFAGSIATINVFKGDLLNPGTKVVRLISNGRFVQLELSEEDYFGVEVGQAVTLRLASYPNKRFDGKVSSLGQVANSNSKTRMVFVRIDAPDSELVPGLTGEGYLVKSERNNALLIPRRALIGNLVYVANRGEVEIRRVRAGFLGLNQAEILEGLEEGDLVILEKQGLLREGDSVQVKKFN